MTVGEGVGVGERVGVGLEGGVGWGGVESGRSESNPVVSVILVKTLSRNKEGTRV